MAKGYHHLTLEQRSQIYLLKAAGTSMGEIARILQCHPSTISRELKRNQGARGYRYQQANGKAVERRAKASRTFKKLNQEMIVMIEEMLLKNWSPEQISDELKLVGNGISHETIYRHVWRDKRSGGFLYKHLRHCGKKYNRRSL
jgi:IS30 family transposase